MVRTISGVNTFLNAVHVVAAVLVTGPLVAAPLAARWLIGRRHAEGVRLVANLLALFGVGIVLVAGFGVATLLTSDEWTATTPWVIISATLFVVALGLVWGYAVPALRTAATLVAAEATAAGSDQPAPAAMVDLGEPADEDGPAAELTDTAPDAGSQEPAAATLESAEDIRRRYRLDSISARVTGAGWLLVITFAAIAVLMTARPFA